MTASPSAKPFRIKNRARLIAATVVLQALVLGVGGYFALSAARDHLVKRIEGSVQADNERMCSNFAGLMQREADDAYEFGGEAWERVQRQVELFQAPPGCQLVVLDEHGRILHHPLLRLRPELRTLDMAANLLDMSETGNVLSTRRDMLEHNFRAGVLETPDGRASVAVENLPRLRARVVVYQPRQSLAEASSRITESLAVWCGATGLVLLGVSLVGSSMIVRRYDSALMRVNEQLEHEVERRTRRGLSIRNGLIFGLAKLADYRDTDTGRHLDRICRYSAVLAQELAHAHPEIDHDWIERLRVAASMHDIGKVGIPDAILLKPGRFTPAERTIMERHAAIGADTLLAIRARVGDDDLLNMAIQITLSHHERHDGGGYPFGLKGAQIPLAARIVAVADMYDALTSKRVYKLAFPHEEARATIMSERGTHFDPEVADAFDRIHHRFEEARQELSWDEFHQPDRLEALTQRVRMLHPGAEELPLPSSLQLDRRVPRKGAA